MYNIFVDDKKFTLSKKTLDNHTESLLYQVIVNNEISDITKKDVDNIYIDTDPLIFSIIIKLIRGYEVNVSNDENMYKDTLEDIKKFNINSDNIKFKYTFKYNFSFEDIEDKNNFKNKRIKNNFVKKWHKENCSDNDTSISELKKEISITDTIDNKGFSFNNDNNYDNILFNNKNNDKSASDTMRIIRPRKEYLE